MLRNVLIFSSVLVLAWWVRDGDARALKHHFMQFTSAKTHFTPDSAPGASDWGSH